LKSRITVNCRNASRATTNFWYRVMGDIAGPFLSAERDEDLGVCCNGRIRQA